MKKLLLISLLTLLTLNNVKTQVIWDGSIATSFAGGDGTNLAPYQISNGAELAYLAQQINSGHNYSDTYFVLTTDILLNDTTDWQNWIEDNNTGHLNVFNPIGFVTHETAIAFNGNFDGQQYCIFGVYINSENIYQGLFGYNGQNGTIQNLSIKASRIKGNNFVGGICGCNDGIINKCYNGGIIDGKWNVAGISGHNTGNITNCHNTGIVQGTLYRIGGIAGFNGGHINQCYNTGTIIGSENSVGGISGENSSYINNSYNVGNIIGINNDLTPEKNNAAELTGFAVSNVASGYTVKQPNVDHVNKIVKISVTETGFGAFSFRATASVSDGAKLSGALTSTNGNSLSFDAISNSTPFDPDNYMKTFTITSEDGTNTVNWTIVVSYEPQLANSDMSIWTNNTTPGGDWASANNSYVTLTTKGTEGSNTYARLEAKKAPVVSTFAAGNLFLGYFQMNISQMNTPKKMTYFGIPFTAKPLSLTTDISYTPGGSTDKGSIEIHLLHYDGPAGQFEYHTIGDEANITVVGQGRAEFGATNGWETKTVNVEYTSDLLPTHIHVAYSTSYLGDQLKGDVGSLMYVDNVKLNY